MNNIKFKNTILFTLSIGLLIHSTYYKISLSEIMGTISTLIFSGIILFDSMKEKSRIKTSFSTEQSSTSQPVLPDIAQPKDQLHEQETHLKNKLDKYFTTKKMYHP